MEWVSGNLFIRDMDSFTTRHEAGWRMDGHQHNFDHNTLIALGRYRCLCWAPIVDDKGEPRMGEDGMPLKHLVWNVIRNAGSVLFIDKNYFHSFECLEGPGILMCLYSHRDPQSGEVTQTYEGWQKAYT